MTMDLYPIYTAPGGQSDMHFTKENTFFSIETTIHNTVNKIIDHEFRSSCEHLLSHKQTTNNNILILIVIKKFNRDNKLINYFKIHGSVEAKSKMKNFDFYTYNFADLVEISEFK